MRLLLKTFSLLIFVLVFALIVSIIIVGWVFWSYGQNLPDYKQLAKYEPPVVTRIYASNGALLAEFAKEKRVFVPIQSIPPLVIEAFLSSEDKDFFNHFGIDFKALVRAILTNIKKYQKGERAIGASTITQQVAKNFLLSSDYTYERKIKEAILSLRIEKAFSKEHILEMYLNEIYLGYGSYGIAAAALNYFNKALNELTLSELAYLAALPKAPSNYHPERRKKQAIGRRNWVLKQMYENGYITESELSNSSKEDLQIIKTTGYDGADAPFPVEEIRRELLQKYGEKSLYTGGLAVTTSISPEIQKLADKSLRKGLEELDRRQGWRGPLTSKTSEETIDEALERASFMMPENYILGYVKDVSDQQAELILNNKNIGILPLQNALWARKKLPEQNLGETPDSLKKIIKSGDIVPLLKPQDENMKTGQNFWMLSQKPEVSGALIAMDPHTGRVLAMSGGYHFNESEFNRSTQAWRQPGSAFKPFIYLAALEQGYAPTTLIRDAPLVIDQGPGLPKWKPANYSKKFYGPSTMRLGVEKSRNLMTARLALELGMDTVREIAVRFGIRDDLPLLLSMSLGAGETTLIRLVSAYAMIVNGGNQIKTSLIDRIQDRRGSTIYLQDIRECKNCQPVGGWSNQSPPMLPDNRKNVVDEASAFQMTSILRGVVERGTGIRLNKLNLNLAGKTGTTNNNTNAWFVGFSPDLVVGVYVGYDIPKPLGKRETGSSAAVPIFGDFMKNYFNYHPDIPFRRPDGIRLIPVDSKTGIRANTITDGVIEEAFKPGQIPENIKVLNYSEDKNLNSEVETSIY